ncbi:SMC-Scp complex subunit ScpB [Brackiella oedipodis]|uniref:SMC-Scp complex subunit ScpB n=1 Tax=Brackiella oedipodis TaxID=124225 RepID=UPI0009FC2E5B|nr:SMC-Scp complex subunit ScpB [Brackiella oedipodis]
MQEQNIETILETVLLCSETPLKVPDLAKLFTEQDAIRKTQIQTALLALQVQWQDKGMQLQESAGGWRFVSQVHMQKYLERLTQAKPPKYSRAVLETLAIIAWKQPVSRGDIEDIRGVTVSSQIIKTLENRGWIEVVGYRDAPGKPSLLGTTRQFLDDLGLKTLSDLPELSSEADLTLDDSPELSQLLAQAPVQASDQNVDQALSASDSEASQADQTARSDESATHQVPDSQAASTTLTVDKELAADASSPKSSI